MQNAQLFTDRNHGLFTDHDYWTMHDGDEIRFNLEDYQPYEPESCLDESYVFGNITINGKPTDHYDLTASEYSVMVTTIDEGVYYEY